MIEVTGRKKIDHNPSYDTSTFVNNGPFFKKHPDVIPNVTRFESTDCAGKLIESWERDKNGRMVNTTKRDKLYAELIEAQEQINKLKENK